MADKTTTTRVTMGTSVASGVKAAPTIKGRSIKRKGPTGMLEAATANHKANIQESLGAKLHPTVTLYQANSAEASKTLRNVRIVASKSGWRD